MLVQSSAREDPYVGETVLVQAAAGGVRALTRAPSHGGAKPKAKGLSTKAHRKGRASARRSAAGAVRASVSVRAIATASAFATPGDRTVVAPNHDTMYTVSQLDLRDGPMVIDAPATGGRYSVLQLLDAYTNAVSYIGAGAAIACPSAVGYATAGTACNGVQASLTTSVQNQYGDLPDPGGAPGSAGWRPRQVLRALGIPGRTVPPDTAARAPARRSRP